MAKHRRARTGGIDSKRVGGGLVIGALASGALAVGALSAAGDANASCVAAGGWFRIGSGCTATAPGDFAIAFGEGATAYASGGWNTAISFGTDATTNAVGKGNTAIGRGLGATAGAYGNDNTAIAIGDGAAPAGGGAQRASMASRRPTTAIAGTPNVEPGGTKKLASGGAAAVDSHNTAIAIGDGAGAAAGGGNNNYARAMGENSIAVAGYDRPRMVPAPELARAAITATPETFNNNTAIAEGDDSEARAVLGNNNTARARGTNSHALAGGVIVPDDTNTLIAVGGGTVLRGSNNSASVRGNNSRALAGGPAAQLRAFGSTARATALSIDNNTASVRGNDSLAAAGPGSGSRARVIANNSSARARDGERVTVRRDNVDPPREAEQE
jgi:hypothetical protein